LLTYQRPVYPKIYTKQGLRLVNIYGLNLHVVNRILEFFVNQLHVELWLISVYESPSNWS